MKKANHLGKSSRAKLDTCDSRLIEIAEKALSYGVMDFSVTCGHRSIEEQQKLFKQGLTRIDGVSQKGKHNYSPSLAMDLMPYPAIVNGVDVWQDKQRFCVLAGLIYAASAELGYSVRWGGDWDGDGNNADSKFHDLPHFEVKE
jgi:peptidoglycan L-alanyl-D-glutamate endopeptidase CwlK